MKAQTFIELMEIDAPPVAYLEVNGGSSIVRITFRTVIFMGPNKESVRRQFRNFLDELEEITRPTDLSTFVWWRTRPEFTRELRGRKEICVIYSRLEVTPPLPDSFWEKYEKKEGQPFKAAK